MLKRFAKNPSAGLLNIWPSTLVAFRAQGIAGATIACDHLTTLWIFSPVDKVLICDSSRAVKDAASWAGRLHFISSAILNPRVLPRNSDRRRNGLQSDERLNTRFSSNETFTLSDWSWALILCVFFYCRVKMETLHSRTTSGDLGWFILKLNYVIVIFSCQLPPDVSTITGWFFVISQ